ncbi:MAG: MocR-like pyridoxine biosynthesis transcription factor PdxR [Thermohalobaculum sp.]
MAANARRVLLSMVDIDREAPVPLYQQLDSALRKAVLSGSLKAGARLPATRSLAEDLGISRLTVQNVYEQLVAEGYFLSRRGSGTYVASIAAENLPPQRLGAGRAVAPRRQRLSQRSLMIERTRATTRLGEVKPFRPGVPALDLFPRRAWAQCWSAAVNKSPPGAYGYGDMAGSLRLRQAIADHLGDARGVNCDAGQVIITTGAQQAFSLIAFSLLDPGVVTWIEDPGHIAARDAMTSLSAQVFPVPIDAEGLDLDYAVARYQTPWLIFVTPSHQHPLGVTMSLRRRMALLNYANSVGAWIVEDDYDSEFRYRGRPLAALQGLDENEVVLYVGSFSKTLFPGLRLGYLVAPPDLVDVFMAAQGILIQGVSSIAQEAVATFIEQGRFAAHIRKMRLAYRERSDRLVEVLCSEAGGLLNPVPPQAGMHLLAELDGIDEGTACEAIWNAGVDALPLSIYSVTAPVSPALVLGFACAPTDEIPKLGRTLARAVIDRCAKSAGRTR